MSDASVFYSLGACLCRSMPTFVRTFASAECTHFTSYVRYRSKVYDLRLIENNAN